MMMWILHTLLAVRVINYTSCNCGSDATKEYTGYKTATCRMRMPRAAPLSSGRQHLIMRMRQHCSFARDSTMATPLLLVLILFTMLLTFVDALYFARFFYFVTKFKLLRLLTRRPKHPDADVLQPAIVHGMVLPSHIDYLKHMNNAKYVREMNFGRTMLYLESGLLDVTRKLGAGTLIAAISIRYRKSLQLWQRFTLATKILHWDDCAFYLEQRFVGSEGFTHAIALVKMVVRSKKERFSPSDIIKMISTRDEDQIKSPPLSPELDCWIQTLLKSKERMKSECLSGTQPDQHA